MTLEKRTKQILTWVDEEAEKVNRQLSDTERMSIVVDILKLIQDKFRVSVSSAPIPSTPPSTEEPKKVRQPADLIPMVKEE